jgi:hypothetical protein
MIRPTSRLSRSTISFGGAAGLHLADYRGPGIGCERYLPGDDVGQRCRVVGDGLKRTPACFIATSATRWPSVPMPDDA